MSKRSRDFYMVEAQASWDLVVNEYDKIGGYGLRVLIAIMARSGFGNSVIISQQEIADAFQTSRSNISAAVRDLKAAKLIKTSKGIGGVMKYHISPRLMWKGDVSGLGLGMVKFGAGAPE